MWSQVSPDVIHRIRDVASRRQWPVYLQGATGVGKSFAAALVCQSWRQPTALWFSLAHLCDTLRSYVISPIQTFVVQEKSVELSLVGFWSRVQRADLVVIDEIGARNVSDHRYDTLLQVLDLRKARPLILTGNLDEMQIMKAYDARVLSRISEGTLINYIGPDRRLVGVENRFYSVE